jgi:hypothetical protein
MRAALPLFVHFRTYRVCAAWRAWSDRGYVTMALEKCLAAAIIEQAAFSIIKYVFSSGIFIAKYNRDAFIKIERSALHCFYLGWCNFRPRISQHFASFCR